MQSYLIFGVNNNATLKDLIKSISINFKVSSITIKKSDFIKFNKSYIYKNNKIIHKIINYKKDFDNNIIDQILYFETEPEYINFINIIKSNNKTIIKKSSKNLILPKYFNSPNYKYYYLIEFNVINYIKYIQENNTFEENVDKLNNINNLFKNFDIKEYNPKFVRLNVFCDEFEEKSFDIITNYINEKLNVNDNNYYKLVGDNNNVYIITDEKVNKFIDDNINEINTLTHDEYLPYAQINIDKKYIDKIDINYLSIDQMYLKYKDSINRDNIILNYLDLEKEKHRIYNSGSINNYWDYINYYYNTNFEHMDSYFLIYSDYTDKANFVKDI